MDNSILPAIEEEIRLDYKIKDWSQFDYITVEPPTWAYWVMILVMGLTQGGYWYWAMTNTEEKE